MIPGRCRTESRKRAFTIVELVTILAAASLLALLLLPRLARAATASAAETCLANLRALASAWARYAGDHGERLPNNLSVGDTDATVASKRYDTWANNVLDWSTSTANTNGVLLAAGLLGSYLPEPASVFKCPADTFLSPTQRARGWSRRVRSYSMNGFMGRLFGTATNETGSEAKGISAYNAAYRQFRQLGGVSRPDSIFVFLEEHPDSINDGAFFNDPAPRNSWGDIPANLHNGTLNLVFADGHGEHHEWVAPTNLPAVRFTYTSPVLRGGALEDYRWLSSRQTVRATELLVTRAPSNEVLLAWSQLADTIVPQSTTDPAGGAWSNLNATIAKSLGLKTVRVPLDEGSRFFRLRGP